MKKCTRYLSIAITVAMLILLLSSFTFAQRETPLMTIACISDLHNQNDILNNASIRGTINEVCSELANSDDIDVLIIGGDVSSDNQVSKDKLDSVLANVVNATTKVTDNVLWVTGNHDYSCGERDGYDSAPYYDLYMKDNVGELAENECYYEDYNGTPNLLAYHYVINGFDFVCINTAHKTLEGNLQNYNYVYTDGAIQWVDNKLSQIGQDKTVFVIGHFPFNDSNSLSSSSKGLIEPCNTDFKNILAKYPNAIYLYGHDHGTDSAYIRTDTAQRVTSYLSDGSKAASSTDITEINENVLWAFEASGNGYNIKNVQTGKYLGIDGNLNTVDSPVIWTLSDDFYLNYNGESVHCGTGNKFSYGSPSVLTFYKKDGDYYKKVHSVENGEQYIIACGEYALTNMTNGASGNAIRMEPLKILISGDYAGNIPQSSAEPSFTSAFMGSMRYYNNSIDGSVNDSNAKVVQSLIIYVYSDRIELQMKNYGIMHAGSYELKPYIIERTVVDTSGLDFSRLNELLTEADNIKKSVNYELYTPDSKTRLDNAINSADVKFVYQTDIDYAVQQLEDAVSSLEFIQIPVDKTSLNLAISVAQLIKSDPDYETSYSVEKRAEFEKALADAKAMLESDNEKDIAFAAQNLLLMSHDMAGHIFKEYISNNDATCTTDGTKTATCELDGCGVTDTIIDADTALGHDWDEGKVTTPATCKTEGVKTYTCKNNPEHTKTESTPADPAAHVWGEYVYNNDATTEADGTETATCELCGAEDTRTAEGTKLEAQEIIDSTTIFTDMESGRWYKEYVDYVATFKLMNGMTPTTFEPTTTLNRAMFAQILANMSGVDTSDNSVGTVFTDVPAGKWYTPAVKWAYDNGIVDGMTPTTFEPLEPIQRQQICVMVVRYAEKFGIELTADIEKKAFEDDSNIQNYAKDAVYICQQAGIVDGKTETEFLPRDNATRAEIATIIMRFHKNFIAK